MENVLKWYRRWGAYLVIPLVMLIPQILSWMEIFLPITIAMPLSVLWMFAILMSFAFGIDWMNGSEGMPLLGFYLVGVAILLFLVLPALLV